uniref:Uncharacterized protein n=1 Tax=Anguilla anguilla TaxID=7936 RepID=A0A0E9W0X8_ANGAN
MSFWTGSFIIILVPLQLMLITDSLCNYGNSRVMPLTPSYLLLILAPT